MFMNFCTDRILCIAAQAAVFPVRLHFPRSPRTCHCNNTQKRRRRRDTKKKWGGDDDDPTRLGAYGPKFVYSTPQRKAKSYLLIYTTVAFFQSEMMINEETIRPSNGLQKLLLVIIWGLLTSRGLPAVTYKDTKCFLEGITYKSTTFGPPT